MLEHLLAVGIFVLSVMALGFGSIFLGRSISGGCKKKNNSCDYCDSTKEEKKVCKKRAPLLPEFD